MESKFRGKVIAVINQSGISKEGKRYEKYQIIVENVIKVNGYRINDKMAATFINTTIPSPCLVVGTEVEMTLNIGAREYNGKWYTDVYGEDIVCLKRDEAFAKAQEERVNFPVQMDETEAHNQAEQNQGDLPF